MNNKQNKKIELNIKRKISTYRIVMTIIVLLRINHLQNT